MNKDAIRRCRVGIDSHCPPFYDWNGLRGTKNKWGVAPMDELDRKIISLLQLDGRASNAKIAREVGLAKGRCGGGCAA